VVRVVVVAILTGFFNKQTKRCNNVDWSTLTQVVVENYHADLFLSVSEVKHTKKHHVVYLI
jgi:hypothetical protein